MSRTPKTGTTRRGVDRIMGALILCTLATLVIWGCAKKDHTHAELADTEHAHVAMEMPAEATVLVNEVENLALQAVWFEKPWTEVMACLDTAEECLGAPDEGPPGTTSYDIYYKMSGVRWMTNKIENRACESFMADEDSWPETKVCLEAALVCLKVYGEDWPDGSACPWPQSEPGGPCLPDNKGP